MPWPSCSSWATDMLALPSTAEMLTGTSNTGARSAAVFSSRPRSAHVGGRLRPAPNSSRARGRRQPWSVSFAGPGIRGSACRPSAASAASRACGDAFGGGLVGIEGRAAVAPVEDEGGAAHAVGLGLDDDLAGDSRRPRATSLEGRPAGVRRARARRGRPGAARPRSRGPGPPARPAAGAPGNWSSAASAILRARGQRQLGGAGAVLVGDLRPGVGRAWRAGRGDRGQGLRPGVGLGLGDGRALALGIGLGADRPRPPRA